jgi:hypothetical protein
MWYIDWSNPANSKHRLRLILQAKPNSKHSSHALEIQQTCYIRNCEDYLVESIFPSFVCFVVAAPGSFSHQTRNIEQQHEPTPLNLHPLNDGRQTLSLGRRKLHATSICKSNLPLTRHHGSLDYLTLPIGHIQAHHTIRSSLSAGCLNEVSNIDPFYFKRRRCCLRTSCT